MVADPEENQTASRKFRLLVIAGSEHGSSRWPAAYWSGCCHGLHEAQLHIGLGAEITVAFSQAVGWIRALSTETTPRRGCCHSKIDDFVFEWGIIYLKQGQRLEASSIAV